MAPRPGTFQASFTGGVVDDTLVERSDVEIYKRGLASGRNIEILPQGGARQADGTKDLGPARGAFVAIAEASNTVAGATGVTGNQTLGTIIFTGVVQLVAVDVFNVRQTTANGSLLVEYSNGGASWAQLGRTVTLETRNRSRRFATAPGTRVTADRVRVRVTDPTATPYDLVLQTTAAWTEQATPPAACRVRPFTTSRDAIYDFVYTPGNIDVWGYDGAGNDVWHAAIYWPHTAAHIESVASDGTFDTFGFTQSLDTEIIFHKDVAPFRVLRLGTNTDWDSGFLTFTNIPDHDYGGTYVATAEIWEVQFINTNLGDRMVLTVSGEETLGFTAPAGYGAPWEPNLQAAIETAPNVKAGVSVTYLSGALFRVTFTGTGNEGPWPSMTGKVLNNASAAIACTRIQRGVAGGEPIMSSTRGWPRCGTIWQQRLIMGGLKNLPATLLMSVTGEFFNLDTRRAAADNGLVLPLDVDADEVIHRLYPGRHLQVFTSSGEYWFSDRVFDATEPLTIVLGTRNGIAGHVPVYENEGSTLYVANNRSMLFDYTYTNEAQSYDSLNISLLSSSQLRDVRDAALLKASSASDANRLLLVDGQGRIITMSILRAQNIQAPVPRVTDGAFLAVSVNGRNDVTVLARRTIDGADQVRVERMRPGLLLDQTVTGVVAGTSVTGLEVLEGASVWAIADQAPVGPFTVTEGRITLAHAASSVTVGRWIAPEGETLDLPTDIAPSTVAQRKRRVHTVRANLLNATSFAIGANGQRLYDVPLTGHDADHETGELARPIAGERVLTGLAGWSYGGRVRFSQLRPGTFTLRSLTIEAD
jgi:hypothetical protein